jgi:hypothetical protein
MPTSHFYLDFPSSESHEAQYRRQERRYLRERFEMDAGSRIRPQDAHDFVT